MIRPTVTYGSPGDVAGGPEGSNIYNGKVSGAFRWKVADADYVGELSATSAEQKLNAQIQLSAPFAARANATLGETKELPWQLTLNVPQFDPRKELLKDSSIESLAAALNAHGDLTFVELRGDVAMNGQSLQIDPARVRYKEQVPHARSPDAKRPETPRHIERQAVTFASTQPKSPPPRPARRNQRASADEAATRTPPTERPRPSTPT